MTLYACSSNPGKLREFVLAGLPIETLPNLKSIPVPEETGSTFEDNARLKAVYYSQFTPELVFADDSGLAVDVLGGEPGVYSARYAGANATDDKNNSLLLKRLAGAQDRRARFVCAVSLARAGNIMTTVHGEVAGEILQAPRGMNGFGYDPLFFYPRRNCGFAELTNEEKFAVSHRGNALRALEVFLRDRGLV
jgi:XTP/dITP diphosphohydrolase